jgi:hypothetical protein
MTECRLSSIILNLGSRWNEWSASQPRCFTLGTYWIIGWAGSRVRLDTVEKRKMSILVAMPTEISRLLVDISNDIVKEKRLMHTGTLKLSGRRISDVRMESRVL